MSVTYTHSAADKAQDAFSRRVDLLGLFLRAVVGPEDDVALAFITKLGSRIVGADRNRLASLLADGSERASRIKANTFDLVHLDLRRLGED